jgi:hypothetical protein
MFLPASGPPLGAGCGNFYVPSMPLLSIPAGAFSLQLFLLKEKFANILNDC